MNPKAATIVIPVLNEEHTLGAVLSGLNSIDCVSEVIVVDDGSQDNSSSIASQKNVCILRHPYNIGNGAAVKTGIRAAKGDYLIFLDSDGQHDPEDIHGLLKQMEKFDMVVGARNARQHASLARYWMNFVYNRISSYVTGVKVEDLTSGFRAVRTETARELLPLLPNGYSWPTTMTLVLLRSGMSIKYVPINVKPRQHGRSRIRPVRDGIRFFMIIMKICTLYSPFRIFLPVASALFGLGLINYAFTFFTAGRFTNMSAVLFTSAVIVFMMGLVSEQISQISLLRQQVRLRDTGQNASDPGGDEDGTA